MPNRHTEGARIVISVHTVDNVQLLVDWLTWQSEYIAAVLEAQRRRGGGPVTAAEALAVRPDLARSPRGFTWRAKRLVAAPATAEGLRLVAHSVTPQHVVLWAVMRDR